MKKILIVVIPLTALGCLGYWLTHRSNEAAAPDEAPKGTAQVETVDLVRKDLSEKITAYGSIVAQPGKSHSVSVAFESRVRHILVAPGQSVNSGDPLFEVEASPAAQLQIQQATSTLQSAQRELKQVEERLKLKLATNQEVNTAEKSARDAEAQRAALVSAGAIGDNKIRSDVSGVVSKLNVQDGQIVAVGSPLVELVAEEEIEVKLGVETEDLPTLQTGQPVSIFTVNSSQQAQVEATVRLITKRVDPMTRLIDVYAALPAGTKLLLDGFIRGEFQRTSSSVMVVPRSAVLPDDNDGFQIFTVENGHAKKHPVKLGIQNDQEVEIISPELKAGEKVVTVGNYELEDGMAVESAHGK